MYIEHFDRVIMIGKDSYSSCLMFYINNKKSYFINVNFLEVYKAEIEIIDKEVIHYTRIIHHDSFFPQIKK